MTESPLSQFTYQVRLDWGVDAVDRLAPAHVVVVVDALAAGDVHADDPAVAVAARAAGSGAAVLRAGLGNASAVAEDILRRQRERGERTSVSVIPAGEPDQSGLRFAVEDLLAAGAVIAALADRGIDHCSPDAAVAGEAFRALRGASRHLLTASASGRMMDATGRRDEVLAAASIDARADVPEFRDGAFV